MNIKNTVVKNIALPTVLLCCSAPIWADDFLSNIQKRVLEENIEMHKAEVEANSVSAQDTEIASKIAEASESADKAVAAAPAEEAQAHKSDEDAFAEIERDYSYQIKGVSYETFADSESYKEVGQTSWYGGRFHGRRTASGEIFNMYKMTAAHRTLPLGTKVKVKNLNNGKIVEVTINDRGPFHNGRVLDLSYAAAKALGFHRQGTALVEITAI